MFSRFYINLCIIPLILIEIYKKKRVKILKIASYLEKKQRNIIGFIIFVVIMKTSGDNVDFIF